MTPSFLLIRICTKADSCQFCFDLKLRTFTNGRQERKKNNSATTSATRQVRRQWVFGGHLSARAAFRLDRKSPAIRPCV